MVKYKTIYITPTIMKQILFGLASLLVFASSAFGSVHMFQYKSQVSKIEYLIDTTFITSLESVALPYGTATLGDAVIGTFSYDPSSAEPYVEKWGGAQYEPPLSTMNIGLGSIVAGGMPQGGIAKVYDNDYEGGDFLGLFSYYYSWDYRTKEELDVMFDDPAGNVLHSHYLPGQETLDFTSGRLVYEITHVAEALSGDWYTYTWRVHGDISSISLISAVPEPSTYAMLLAGLGMMAWRRRKGG